MRINQPNGCLMISWVILKLFKYPKSLLIITKRQKFNEAWPDRVMEIIVWCIYSLWCFIIYTCMPDLQGLGWCLALVVLNKFLWSIWGDHWAWKKLPWSLSTGDRDWTCFLLWELYPLHPLRRFLSPDIGSRVGCGLPSSVLQ